MITRFNNRTVTVRRLRATSRGRNYSATATVECNIQNLSDTDSATKEGVAKKIYKLYFDIDTDIQINDKLIDQDGRSFKVVALEKLGDGMGLSIEHLEVLAENFNA